MEGHIVGTGVSVPSPLQAKCFGKAGVRRPQVDWWAKLERDRAKGGLPLLLWLQQESMSLKTLLPTPDIELEPHKHL